MWTWSHASICVTESWSQSVSDPGTPISLCAFLVWGPWLAPQPEGLSEMPKCPAWSGGMRRIFSKFLPRKRKENQPEQITAIVKQKAVNIALINFQQVKRYFLSKLSCFTAALKYPFSLEEEANNFPSPLLILRFYFCSCTVDYFKALPWPSAALQKADIFMQAGRCYPHILQTTCWSHRTVLIPCFQLHGCVKQEKVHFWTLIAHVKKWL